MLSLVVMRVALATVAVAPATGEFPLRAKFPDVPTISTEELRASYDDVIIVDARSQVEFDVVHIAKAVNVPVARADFVRDLEKLRAPKGTRLIVFYCNGHTCAKSYEATAEAIKAGFTHVAAYDAGVFTWVKSYPELGVLLGASPVDPAKLISDEQLRAHMLPYAEFARRAAQPGVLLIDMREPMQRAFVPKLPGLYNLYGEQLNQRIGSRAMHDKTVLILDAVGKQVRWLQYRLESAGIKDYYFLEGGVASIPR